MSDFDGRVPILMYHAIGSPPPGATRPELFVPVPELAEQAEWLAREGYEAVTLGELFAAWDEGATIAERPVVLSFDDGLRSQYVGALPVLRERGWPGVLNLKVESLDQGELTEEMVGELVAAGWEVGSHTFTHADVATLDGSELEQEIAGSGLELEHRLGVPIEHFAYPAGSHDREAIAAVREAGYRGAVGTEPGLASSQDRFSLARIRIEPGDGAAGLAEKLATAR